MGGLQALVLGEPDADGEVGRLAGVGNDPMVLDGAEAGLGEPALHLARGEGELAMGEEMRPSAQPLLNGGMKTFQFLPDGRGWLLGGMQIVERETGKVVWKVDSKTEGDARNRRFVESYLVSVEGKKKEKAITLTPLPPEYETAMKKAQTGAAPK